MKPCRASHFTETINILYAYLGSNYLLAHSILLKSILQTMSLFHLIKREKRSAASGAACDWIQLDATRHNQTTNTVVTTIFTITDATRCNLMQQIATGLNQMHTDEPRAH